MSKKRYIDRELLINEICKNRLMSKELVAQKILHIINEQPTANVDKERQGKWERSEKNFSYYQYKCNNCGCDDYTQTDRQGECKLMNYCPNCGAKMVLGDDLNGG